MSLSLISTNLRVRSYGRGGLGRVRGMGTRGCGGGAARVSATLPSAPRAHSHGHGARLSARLTPQWRFRILRPPYQSNPKPSTQPIPPSPSPAPACHPAPPPHRSFSGSASASRSSRRSASMMDSAPQAVGTLRGIMRPWNRLNSPKPAAVRVGGSSGSGGWEQAELGNSGGGGERWQ